MNWLLALLLFSTTAIAQTKILGAGATFPYPLYSKWIQEYQKQNPKVEINYQSIGSGGGVKQLSMGLVDFGASDVQLTPQEKKLFKTEILEVPMTIGGVVVAYNLKDVKDLKISREAQAGIFSGKIVRWNDEVIQKANPGVKLPALPIKVAVRADASGTTAVFTEYLSMISPEFKKKVGVGKAVQWPMMVAKGKGNDGVTALIKATEGSLGYVELAYAVNQNLSTAILENKKGNWVKPSLETFTKAANAATKGSYQILDTEDSQGWPITAFTFILLPKEGRDPKVKPEVKSFITWALTEGQKYAKDLHYAPLPESLTSELGKKVKNY